MFKSVSCLLVALVFTSCSTGGKNSFLDAFSGPTEYERQFRENTLKRSAQSSFENTATAEVTFWNDALRKEFIAESKERYRLPPEEVDLLRMKEYSEGEKYFVFIVSLTTRDPKGMKLSSSDGVWRMSLENAEATVQVQPRSVDQLDYENGRNQFFYLHMNRFNETFKLRFPKRKLTGAKEISLHLDGPLGSLEYNFQVDNQGPER